MAKVSVSFTMDSENDRDLVRWMDGIPKRQRSAMIRGTLRAGLQRGGVTLGDVYQAVKELDQKIQVGAVVLGGRGPAQQADGWPEEPPEAAAALDALANL